MTNKILIARHQWKGRQTFEEVQQTRDVRRQDICFEETGAMNRKHGTMK